MLPIPGHRIRQAAGFNTAQMLLDSPPFQNQGFDGNLGLFRGHFLFFDVLQPLVEWTG